MVQSNQYSTFNNGLNYLRGLPKKLSHITYRLFKFNSNRTNDSDSSNLESSLIEEVLNNHQIDNIEFEDSIDYYLVQINAHLDRREAKKYKIARNPSKRGRVRNLYKQFTFNKVNS